MLPTAVFSATIRNMILVTHSLIGAALAHKSVGVAVAFVTGLASHYIFDMIPHWHYPVPKIKEAIFHSFGAKSMTLHKRYWPEFVRIALDLAFGVALAFFVFDGAPLVIASAIIGAVLPDLLVGFVKFHPLPILVWHDRFHRWIHSKARLDGNNTFGIASQAAIALFCIWLFV